MIGNTRLYMAVFALSTSNFKVKQRVVIALRNLSVINKNEFQNDPDLWDRIQILLKKASISGPLVINNIVKKDKFENTSYSRHSKTYTKYSEEILSIWIQSLESYSTSNK